VKDIHLVSLIGEESMDHKVHNLKS
jgi:hypothetical protein